jgi:hypothetical protein
MYQPLTNILSPFLALYALLTAAHTPDMIRVFEPFCS